MGTTRQSSYGAPWDRSRRPLVLFGLIVILALVTMVASVSWTSSRALDQGPLPSAFVAYASRTCATTLDAPRPSTLPATPAAVTAQDDQLDALAGQLRSLAITTGANPQAAGWLAAWQRYTTDERQRAAALSTKPASSPGAPSAQTSAPPAGTVAAGAATTLTGPDPVVLGSQAVAAAVQADTFAAANDLQSCAILAQGPAGAESIPP